MMKGEKMVKRSSFGTIRKRLSDITNSHSQHKSLLKEKPTFDEFSTKDYIQQLLKENAVMVKVIQERDKIIETTEVEMQKLKTSLQKSQLQNLHLAQSNSHMFGELNLSKDKLKTLQHELACKDAMFKAKILELEDKRANNQCQAMVKERETPDEKEAADHPPHPENDNDQNKVPKAKKKRPARSQSLGPTTSQQATQKEMAENKRRCLRRQSMRLKPQVVMPQVELFEIDVAKFPMTPPQPHKDNPNSSKDEEDKHGSSTKASQLRRSSLGRPLRRATEKVQSYKEPSRIVKMRRPE